jgi:hypothetical protein
VINQIRLSPNGALFAAANRGIWRSLDSGRSWELRTPIQEMMLEVVINRLGVLFAASLEQGLYRSVDNGESWHTIHGERYPNETAKITRITLAPDGRLYGVTSRGFFYRTTGSTTGVRRTEEAPEELDLGSDARCRQKRAGGGEPAYYLDPGLRRERSSFGRIFSDRFRRVASLDGLAGRSSPMRRASLSAWLDGNRGDRYASGSMGP